MKFKFLTFSFLIAGFLGAQVGINTDNPLSTLDINGDLSLRGKLYVGGDEGTLGNPGLKGQVLVSSGPGLPPKWLTLNIPDQGEKFYLIYNNTFEDQTGVEFSSSEVSGNTIYTKGTLLSALSNWKAIPGLSQTFDVYSIENKVFFTFETVAQLNTTTAFNIWDAADLACGIFVDGKLEGVRLKTVEQTSNAVGTFRTLTMLHVSENIPVGTHSVDVACTRRANYSTNVTLGIGRAVRLENLNNFMAKSTMKIEVFEIPDNFIEP